MKKHLFILLLVASFLIVPLNVEAGTKKVLGKTYQTKNYLETLDDEELEHGFSNYSENSNQITIYLFRGKGCSFCRAYLTYMNSITSEYGKYFKMVSFEVWNDEDNWNLLNQVSYFKDNEISQGVPYVIIGDKVFHGYADTYNEDIKDAIKTLYDTPKAQRYDIFEEAEKNGLPTLEELQALYPSDDAEAGDTQAATTSNESLKSADVLPIILFNLLFVAVGTISVMVFINYKLNNLSKEIKKANKVTKKSK